jgi:hypothetical protein
MAMRCIGNEVFKTIVEMAYEMALADKIDLWCIDRVEVAQAVASRCQEVSLSVRRWGDMKIQRDIPNKQRLLVLYKEIHTGVYETIHYVDDPPMTSEKVITQALILGTYKYSEKRDLYDDLCDYLLENKKTRYSYADRKRQAIDVLEYHKMVNPYEKKDKKEEAKYLLHKIYNTII